MKPKEEMVVLEARAKFKLGNNVKVTNNFSHCYGMSGSIEDMHLVYAHDIELGDLQIILYDVSFDYETYDKTESLEGWELELDSPKEYHGIKLDHLYRVNEQCKEGHDVKPGDIVTAVAFDTDDPEFTSLNVRCLHPTKGLYWFSHTELNALDKEEEKEMDASDSMDRNQDLIEEKEKKDVTYMGLVKGHTYTLKQHHYPMKEGDPVIIKDFDPIDPTSGDRADVLVFHALYGTQWVKYSELEDTIQPVKEKDTFNPGDSVQLREDYETWGIKLPCPNLILRVVERDNLEETECYWLRDAYGHPYYAPAEILIPVKAKADEHHYDGEVQPIELMQAQMTREAFIGFLRGNIIKYAARLGKKDAPEKEAKKIQTYANWLVKVLNNQEIHP